jgi:hypothetical protein
MIGLGKTLMHGKTLKKKQQNRNWNVRVMVDKEALNDTPGGRCPLWRCAQLRRSGKCAS